MATPAFGYVTVVNDLVFATTYDGTISAFDTKTGSVVWREKLPAGTNSGVTVERQHADRAGRRRRGRRPEAQIVAYKLSE